MKSKILHTNNIDRATYIAFKTGIIPVLIFDQGKEEYMFCFVNNEEIWQAYEQYRDITLNQRNLVDDRDIHKFNLILGKLKKIYLISKKQRSKVAV